VLQVVAHLFELAPLSQVKDAPGLGAAANEVQTVIQGKALHESQIGIVLLVPVEELPDMAGPTGGEKRFPLRSEAVFDDAIQCGFGRKEQSKYHHAYSWTPQIRYGDDSDHTV
jgi:hypothetical protein